MCRTLGYAMIFSFVVTDKATHSTSSVRGWSGRTCTCLQSKPCTVAAGGGGGEGAWIEHCKHTQRRNTTYAPASGPCPDSPSTAATAAAAGCSHAHENLHGGSGLSTNGSTAQHKRTCAALHQRIYCTASTDLQHSINNYSTASTDLQHSMNRSTAWHQHRGGMDLQHGINGSTAPLSRRR